MQSRNWCFTVNNPDELLNFDDPIWNNQVIFAVYTLEKGEEGTDHFQGYLELRSSRRIAYLKTRLPRAHLEVRRGTREQAVLYCVKTWEGNTLPGYGEPSLQVEDNSTSTEAVSPLTMTSLLYGQPIWYGLQSTAAEFLTLLKRPAKKKDRMLKIKQMIEDGKTESDIANEDFELWVRSYRAFREYRMIITPSRSHDVEVIVLQGPTGTGKSKWAMDNYPDAYWKQRSIWWDGYSDQETVIIDEFYGWMPFDTLLRVCDRYPLLVESKGGQINFVAKTIIITTNAVPSAWYKNVYFNSFVRRVNKWIILRTWGNMQTFTDYSEAVSHFVLNE